jgi:hypothetical protein
MRINKARLVVLPAILLLLCLTGCPQSGDGGCSDQYEPNETCLQPFDLGIVSEDETEVSWQARICTGDDVDWYRIMAKEDEPLGFPMTEQTFSLRVGLEPPASCAYLDLFLYDDSCALLSSSELTGCLEEEIIYSWDGKIGLNDSQNFIIQVMGADDTQWSEELYTLTVDMWEP